MGAGGDSSDVWCRWGCREPAATVRTAWGQPAASHGGAGGQRGVCGARHREAGTMLPRWGSGSLRGSRQQAGKPAARRQRGSPGAGEDRHGSAGWHRARVQAAATLGRGAEWQWDGEQGAWEQAGRGQGAGRLQADSASGRVPARCCQPRAGCWGGPLTGRWGPRAGCKRPWAGRRQDAGRVQAGCSVTLEEGGDVPGGDAPLLHELPQGHLQEEDGDAAHEDDEQVGDEEDAWGRGGVTQGWFSRRRTPRPPLPSPHRPPGRSEWRRRLCALPSPRPPM